MSELNPSSEPSASSSGSASSEQKSVHPQAWLQAMYSAGRGGLSRGGGRGRGRGRGNYRGRGRGNYRNYDNRNDHYDNKRKRDESNSEEENDGEPSSKKSDLNEENLPEYVKFLQDYKKNYKNPIFSMLYKKPMETPEDIQKYREERRKHYPTKQNVIEKEKELAERRKKGEIIIGASEKVKSLLKIMGIEKDKRGDSNEQDEEKKATPLINNLLTQEINQDKCILLQVFRHVIYERFYCHDEDLSTEVKEKLDRLNHLTQVEMKKLEEFRKRKLGLVDEDLNKPTAPPTLIQEVSDDENFEMSEDSEQEQLDEDDDILGGSDATEVQQIDSILKDISK